MSETHNPGINQIVAIPTLINNGKRSNVLSKPKRLPTAPTPNNKLIRATPLAKIAYLKKKFEAS